jgi:hypothetical protein
LGAYVALFRIPLLLLLLLLLLLQRLWLFPRLLNLPQLFLADNPLVVVGVVPVVSP